MTKSTQEIVSGVEKLNDLCNAGQKIVKGRDGRTYKIRANQYGNWYAYCGSKRVEMFFGDYAEQAQKAVEWLESRA